MSVNVHTCFRNFCFSRFHHLRHSHDHASAVAGGVHRGHDRALLGHHQPVHRNPQDPRQDQQEVNTIHEDRKKEIKLKTFLFIFINYSILHNLHSQYFETFVNQHRR
jgi:hypothetical protein